MPLLYTVCYHASIANWFILEVLFIKVLRRKRPAFFSVSCQRLQKQPVRGFELSGCLSQRFPIQSSPLQAVV